MTQALVSLLELSSGDLTPRPEVRAWRTQDFITPPTGVANQVSVFLYRVAINGNVRTSPPRQDLVGRRFKPSLPVDLHYLVTAWSTDVLRQHSLLGWAMRVLEDNPVLPSSLLVSGTERPFRPEESVDVVAAPISHAEMVAIWEMNKPSMQPSMTYVARMVRIDSNVELPDDLAIRSRRVDAGRQP